MTPVRTNVNARILLLKAASHKLREVQLTGDREKIEADWLEVVEVCKSVRKDFDSAKAMLNPKAFSPYETKWDSCVK